MSINVGDWVRCERQAPAAGTWSRYAGRVGRVVTINHRDREYGVRFTASNDATTWFRADELVAATRPVGAPSVRTDAEWRQGAESGNGALCRI